MMHRRSFSRWFNWQASSAVLTWVARIKGSQTSGAMCVRQRRKTKESSATALWLQPAIMKVATYSPAVALFLLTRRVQLGFAANSEYTHQRFKNGRAKNCTHTLASCERWIFFLQSPLTLIVQGQLFISRWKDTSELRVILEIFNGEIYTTFCFFMWSTHMALSKGLQFILFKNIHHGVLCYNILAILSIKWLI